MPLSPSIADGGDAVGPKSASFESLDAPGPESAREAARRQIIAELLDTERKFVQDLEVMQVRYVSQSLLLLACLSSVRSELRHRAYYAKFDEPGYYP